MESKKVNLKTTVVKKYEMYSPAKMIMKRHNIKDVELHQVSDDYEILESGGFVVGLNRVTLLKIKNGLKCHRNSINKFVTAVNLILESRGETIRYTINDIIQE